MKIEAVTCCVGYGDFLAETVKQNVGLIDRWIIVTSEADEKTRGVCHAHDLEVLVSEDHARDGGDRGEGAFNKGRMVQRALQMVSQDAWRLHLDADIVLPVQFRRLLEGAHLDKRKLYGCDRVMVRSWEEWQVARRSGWMPHSHCNINMPKGRDVGSRWALHDTGYVPIGFFQLWHAQSDEHKGRRFRKYPIAHGAAHRTDVQFALQWDRRDRELLPEVVVVHLESEPCALGANWLGRKTKPFGPHPEGLPSRHVTEDRSVIPTPGTLWVRDSRATPGACRGTRIDPSGRACS